MSRDNTPQDNSHNSVVLNGHGNQVLQSGGDLHVSGDVTSRGRVSSPLFGRQTQPNQGAQQPNEVQTSEHLLFLSANPTTRHLKLDRDIATIENALNRSRMGKAITLVQRWALTPFELRQALLAFSPKIVHFSGHGAQQGLLLQSDSAKAQLIGAAQLAALFELFSASVSCVVLCTCHSQSQAQAIAEHIPYVVGMSGAIKDDLAQAFCSGFYQGVAAGMTFDTAFKLGLNAIAMEAIAYEDAPVLYSHGQQVHGS